MKGISLKLANVDEIKKQFDNLIKDMESKATVKIDLSSLVNQVNQIEKTLNNKNLKIINEEQIKKQGNVLFKTIEEVKNRYSSLGEIKVDILKDADENIENFILRLKQADGIIKQFKFKGVNVGDNSQQGYYKAFMLDNIKEINNTEEIFEKQAQKIQSINKSITEEKQKEIEKQKKDREDYVNWWISQENKLEQSMANLNEKSIIKRNKIDNKDDVTQSQYINKGLEEEYDIRNKVNDAVNKTIQNRRKENEELEKAQAKSINKNLEDQYQETLKEQKRIASLGEFKVKLDDDFWEKSNEEIKEYIQNLYGAEAKVVSFKKNNIDSTVQMTVSTKNNKNQIEQENIVLDKNSQALYKNSEAIKNNNSKNVGFVDRLKNAVIAVTSFATVTSSFYFAIRQIQQGVQIIKDFDESLVNLNKIVDLSSENLNEMKQSAIDMGKALGNNGNEILIGMAEWGRFTKDTEEIKKFTEASTLMSNVTSMSAQESADAIQSAVIQYKLSADEAMKVVDMYNEVQNSFPTDATQISAGISKIGAIAQQVQMPIQETIGFITTLNSVLKISGDESGTALNLGA